MRNTKMFYMIAEAIEEKPELHDQNYWFGNQETAEEPELQKEFVAGREVWCGTTQCIAGWAIAFDQQLKGFIFEDQEETLDVQLSDGTVLFRNGQFIELGAKILGLDYADASTLFTTTSNHDWPNVLRAIGDGDDVEEALERFNLS